MLRLSKFGLLFVGLCFCLTPLLACGLGSVEDEDDPAAVAPDPIGPELLRIEVLRIYCAGGVRYYRSGLEIQSQCFDVDGAFEYENRGAITLEASATLDAELVAVDFEDTEVVNELGMCGAPDALSLYTISVGEDSLMFMSGCPPRGILSLYQHIRALWAELGTCGMGPAEFIESYAPGCRIL